MIDKTAMPLSEIAFAAGFRSVRRFNDSFLLTYKRSPSSFRRRKALILSDDLAKAVTTFPKEDRG